MKPISRCAAVLLFLASALFMAENARAEVPKHNVVTYPRRVLIIRHAEKPPDEANSVHLSAEGLKRAEALYRLFEPSKNRPDPFPMPDFIFAAKDTKQSHRSVETVADLAKKIKRPIESRFRNEDVAGLVEELLANPKYAGKTVLICWHHSTVPQLAQHLKAGNAPDNWKGSVFDRVWEITYDENGRATCADRPQQLLETDARK